MRSALSRLADPSAPWGPKADALLNSAIIVALPVTAGATIMFFSGFVLSLFDPHSPHAAVLMDTGGNFVDWLGVVGGLLTAIIAIAYAFLRHRIHRA